MTLVGRRPRRIVLIGAARSGTKVLRDSLAVATGAGSVPYDIGYVWRSGSLDHPDDVLDPNGLDVGTRDFIKNFIDRYAAEPAGAVVEKTVGNALRVPYVASVLPDAYFVHLIRDGLDVVESTLRQWKAPTDYRYLARKLKHFPARLVPTYGRVYVRSLMRRRLADDGRVATWGPRYPGIDEDLLSEDLLSVCGRQWRESVMRARRDLAELPMPVVEIRYESLVARPKDEIARVADFCGLPVTDEKLEDATAKIKLGLAGHGRRALGAPALHHLDREIGSLMTQLGYDRPKMGEVGG